MVTSFTASSIWLIKPWIRERRAWLPVDDRARSRASGIALPFYDILLTRLSAADAAVVVAVVDSGSTPSLLLRHCW